MRNQTPKSRAILATIVMLVAGPFLVRLFEGEFVRSSIILFEIFALVFGAFLYWRMNRHNISKAI